MEPIQRVKQWNRRYSQLPGKGLLIAIVTLASFALVLFYWLYLKDFISDHNFKWL